MAAPIRPAPLRPPLGAPPGIQVSLKVSATIAGDDLPRIVPGGPDEAVELRLQIPGQPGRPGEVLTARIPARTYLKHQTAVENCDGACTAHLSGRILRAGELADAVLNIQPTAPSDNSRRDGLEP